MMRRLCAALFALLPLALAAAPVQAKLLPAFAPRALTIRADTVVVAEPLDEAVIPLRYRVLEVLHGTGIKPGKQLRLEGLDSYNRTKYADEVLAGRKLKERSAEQAILFLGPNAGTENEPRFPVVGAGLCFLTSDGEVLAPVQPANPGLYALTSVPGVQWASLLRRVREDCAALDRVLFLKRLPPSARRSRELLAWVEQHRRDFGAPPSSPAPIPSQEGWQELESDVFQWALASGDLETAWAAVRLYADINQGHTPPLRIPVFGTPAGRRLLCRVALTSSALEGDRTRALALLGDPQTLWPPKSASTPGVQPLDTKEQHSLIDTLSPLLEDATPSVRSAATAAILRVSDPGQVAPEMRTRRALPVLMRVYRKEPPGTARDDIAAAICQLGGDEHWQELTGNPPGLLARIRDLERKEEMVHFWLQMRPCGLLVRACPTLILERLEPNGKVAERKSMPLPISQMEPPWSAGWDGRALLFAEFPTKGFAQGTWRIRIEGKVVQGEERMMWRTEPRTFTVEAPPPQQQGGYINTGLTP